MTTTLAAIGDFNGLAVAIFAVVLATTLVITWWAARRTRNATEFYTAGRAVAGAFNGIAIAGDYQAASTFLGYAGLMFLFGFDGWIIGLAAMLLFLPVLYLLADRMRNRASSPSPTCSPTACGGVRCGSPPRSTRC